jgi:hypothetical protein
MDAVLLLQSIMHVGTQSVFERKLSGHSLYANSMVGPQIFTELELGLQQTMRLLAVPAPQC